jgi:hypothetical protein
MGTSTVLAAASAARSQTLAASLPVARALLCWCLVGCVGVLHALPLAETIRRLRLLSLLPLVLFRVRIRHRPLLHRVAAPSDIACSGAPQPDAAIHMPDRHESG